jgi:glycosyltransferase EpsE
MRDDRNAYSRRKFKYRINEVKVGASAIKKLHLNPVRYLFCVRPVLVGLLPKAVYVFLHKRKIDM